MNQYLGGIKKGTSLYKELEDELKLSPIAYAVYCAHKNKHGDIINVHECLVDMVRHLVRRQEALVEILTSKLLRATSDSWKDIE